MALGPSPVRTLGCLAAPRQPSEIHRPVHCRGRGCMFFSRNKLPISLETKGGVRQIREQSYRFATWARRRTGRERLLGGEAFYGCFGAGMTAFGTGRRCAGAASRSAWRPRQGARRKPGVLTIKAGMWFCFKGIVLATPPSIKDSDGDPRGGAARPHPLERGAAAPHGVRLGAGRRGG